MGVPLAALSAVLPTTAADTLTHATRAAAVIAAGVAVARRRNGWALIVAVCAAWVVLSAVTGPGLPMLLPYPAVAAGLVWLSRSGGPVAPGLLVDAAVITGAAAIGGWLIVQPTGGSTGLAYVVLDLLLVAAALRLVGFGGRPPPAQLMLTAAVAALVGGDLLHALGAPAYPLHTLWTVGVAAAALHPASDRRPRGRSGPVAVSPRRLAVFAVLALTVPVAPALVEDAPATALVPGFLGAGVALLLVVRLAMLASLVGKTAEALAYTRAQREALRNELTHRANHDPLTGLASRAALTARLNGPQRQGSLVLFDLDGFAEINDAHGHETGDALLMEVAGRLRTVFRNTMLARLGGDEFAVLCRGDAEAAARRALAALRPAYRIGPRELHVTASAGMVRISNPAEALRDADLALDAAKTTGRDRLVLFRPELKEALLRRSTLAGGLRNALDRGELELHFQPVVELATGRIVAAEALLRWRYGGEQVPPVQFVPLAEQTGLIVPIGWWAMREACAQAARWFSRHGVAVTVNVSAHQLREEGFAEGVLDTLSAAGAPGEALIIEVTESVLITDAGSTRAALERLRSEGVRVAVDDFGTGYSSLSYLMSLPVDVLKLDRAFVAPEHEHRQYAITGAVLQLAAVLDLVTIAEGVEGDGQARALTRLKCPLAQGYLYSPPVPAPIIDALLDP
ncbi:putative bifunctional diguanylate cyclase/phosphodiesterase [Virgisporangium ochraceum]|uniref:putative bifunctional diguanylate cyclase/phosphodiesterase n=1 Tax=Virgisporangium ochraceum TaxID=65505 RepID=UPI0019439051|nr:bifunctional diguanylate cyclase/phosphodiesterase [Virgisporangium ochraceum]